ncbi:replication endonuclease [Ralstonia sp.]|uniref:replication endonuclease n=1 Tax=Ralstonia sp. TaxID=54061 RepID=UPI0031D2987E
MRREGNAALLAAIERMDAVRLPLDANDVDVRTRAAQVAQVCEQMGQGFAVLEERRAALERICADYGVECWQGEADRIERNGDACALRHVREQTDRAALARMTCELWWRRKLRTLHAKQFEGAAISLGYVNAARDLYVSEESLNRRAQQVKRNADLLESVEAENEEGYRATLAELASKGVADKAIRRAELMTRIAGFEVIARDLGHAGEFITVTCPSRMHKFTKTKHGKVVPNRKYDGTTPTEARAYLSDMWAKLRAWLDRRGIKLYGFRIAEPNHDGTPHWHLLVFCEPGKQGLVRKGFREYALRDSGGEAGASEHRVRFVSIDWNRGSAAGYIAKYVSKNIDGYRVEKDLYGNDCMTASRRVDAWAATWRIRQFQQVGGPPISVWRELRRVPELPAGAPDFLAKAHDAVNRLANVDAGTVKQASFAAYVRAQGGVHVKRRDMPIRLTREDSGDTTRYGEQAAPRVVGVECAAWETYRDGIVPNKRRFVHWFVQSVRHAWTVVSRHAGRAARGAWTRVNNCTQRDAQSIPHRGKRPWWFSHSEIPAAFAPLGAAT